MSVLAQLDGGSVHHSAPAAGASDTSPEAQQAKINEVRDALLPPEKVRRRFPPVPPLPDGRPAPLSAEEKAHVALYVSYGLSLRQAAAVINRSHTTLSRQLQRDADFAAKVERFRQFAANDALLSIYQASRKSWRAAAWLVKYLDRRAQRRPPLKPSAPQSKPSAPAPAADAKQA